MKAVDYIRKGWTQNAYARTGKGIRCNPESKEAESWCALGAIQAVYGKNAASHINAIQSLYKALYLPGYCPFIAEWNDDPKRTRRQVLAAFRKSGI